jgi:tRNA pseudouridine65 synthase
VLEIIYQDDDVVAINKPAGLLVHRSWIDKGETRFAMQMLRDQIGQYVYPVHRLDKPTSGVLLFALSSEVAAQMGQIFEQGLVQKEYLAVVRGYTPLSGVIDHPLKEELDKMTDKKARQDKPAQPAVTHFERLATSEQPFTIEKYPQSRFSLIKAYPKTGRKHQIRRHMKHISHPIIGDANHGRGRYNRYFKEHLGCGRLLLHAAGMRLRHPNKNEDISISAGMDDDMQRLLALIQLKNANDSPNKG